MDGWRRSFCKCGTCEWKIVGWFDEFCIRAYCNLPVVETHSTWFIWLAPQPNFILYNGERFSAQISLAIRLQLTTVEQHKQMCRREKRLELIVHFSSFNWTIPLKRHDGTCPDPPTDRPCLSRIAFAHLHGMAKWSPGMGMWKVDPHVACHRK